MRITVSKWKSVSQFTMRFKVTLRIVKIHSLSKTRAFVLSQFQWESVSQFTMKITVIINVKMRITVTMRITAKKRITVTLRITVKMTQTKSCFEFYESFETLWCMPSPCIGDMIWVDSVPQYCIHDTFRYNFPGYHSTSSGNCCNVLYLHQFLMSEPSLWVYVFKYFWILALYMHVFQCL